MRKPLDKLPAHVKKAILDPEANRDLLISMQAKVTRTKAKKSADAKIAGEYWNEQTVERAVQDELIRRESANEHIVPTNPEDEE